MPSQPDIWVGVVIKHESEVPTNIVPQPVNWTTPKGRTVTLTPELETFEDSEYEIGTLESQPGGIGRTVHGFKVTGRYNTRFIDVDTGTPSLYDKTTETSNMEVFVLDLDQLLVLRNSVREWFPGAEIVMVDTWY